MADHSVPHHPDEVVLGGTDNPIPDQTDMTSPDAPISTTAHPRLEEPASYKMDVDKPIITHENEILEPVEHADSADAPIPTTAHPQSEEPVSYKMDVDNPIINDQDEIIDPAKNADPPQSAPVQETITHHIDHAAPELTTHIPEDTTEVLHSKKGYKTPDADTISLDGTAVESVAGTVSTASMIDPDEDIYDSDFGNDSASSFMTSISSSITDYPWENGRRYHAYQGGRYPLPNDEIELDREEMKHHEFMLITDFRHHLSPIPESPHRILDLGTGTGIWAVQVAEKYPTAMVVGTDLSPVQPEWVPPNLTFEVDDIEQEWLHTPNSYDLINCRFLFLAVKDFPKMLEQAYKALKPGGYIEISELEINPSSQNPEGNPAQILTWVGYIEQASIKMGYDIKIAKHFKSMLINAGYEDVVETKFDVPWGAWPKDTRMKAIGFYHLEQLKQGLQGITMALFTRILGWSPPEVEVFLVGLRKELDDPNLQIKDHATIVYGRKPLVEALVKTPDVAVC